MKDRLYAIAKFMKARGLKLTGPRRRVVEKLLSVKGHVGADELIELLRKGRTPEEVGRQFEPSAQTIRNWLRQADRDAGRRTDGPTTDEQEELRRLRRENKLLREEREILKKRSWAAAAHPAA